MSSHKTTYTWIIFVLALLTAIWKFKGFVGGIISLALAGNTEYAEYLPSTGIQIINIFFYAAVLAISIVYAIKIFKLNKSTQWTNIFFGGLVAQLIFSLFFSIISLQNMKTAMETEGYGNIMGVIGIASIIPSIIWLAGMVVIWITFSNHLKKAKKEKLMDFS